MPRLSETRGRGVAPRRTRTSICITPTTITSRVGADGVLSVVVPLSPAEANREVRVTVEPVAPAREMSEADWAEWRAWVQSMAGKWQGEFERPPQDDYEQRDPLF